MSATPPLTVALLLGLLPASWSALSAAAPLTYPPTATMTQTDLSFGTGV